MAWEAGWAARGWALGIQWWPPAWLLLEEGRTGGRRILVAHSGTLTGVLAQELAAHTHIGVGFPAAQGQGQGLKAARTRIHIGAGAPVERQGQGLEHRLYLGTDILVLR